MGGKLVADDREVPLRIAAGAVDDLDEDAGPFDVAQEGVPEPGAFARPLDEARNVGDRRQPAVVHAEVHDAEVRLEGRERVVGDLRVRGGQRREQRRLAGVRKAHEADVGDEPELQADPALLAGLTLLGVLRGLVRRRREVLVAEAAAPAPGDHRRLADGDEIGDQGPGRIVVDGRARRDGKDQVRAGLAVTPRPLAATSAGSLEVVAVLEVAKGRLAGIDREMDGGTPAAVTAVGAAARDVRLLAERRRAVTAVAGADVDLHPVEKHGDLSSHEWEGAAAGARGGRPAQK